MPHHHRKQIRYAKKPISKKVKMGNKVVVSESLVKRGTTNLVGKLHVKRGDMVMVMAGSKAGGKGKTGKVLNVFPDQGRIVVEGVNLVTRATKAKTAMGRSGHIKKEGPIFASKVMLYCTGCKKPTRVRHKIQENKKKTRICVRCGEGFDA